MSQITPQIYHDLRNYIFGISGLARMVLESKNEFEISQSEDLRLVKTILEQADEASHFINDLLDPTQNDKEQFTLGFTEACNIGDLVQRAILLNHHFANAHFITVTSDIEENLPTIKCDPRRMKQILINLITNAIKYSGEHNVVRISVKSLKTQALKTQDLKNQSNSCKTKVCIEVADSGIGMSADEISMALAGEGSKIDKSALSKPIDSHGLGIPIIKQLVDLHQGEIEITSEKGKGTIVKLWFDAEESENSSQSWFDLQALNRNSWFDLEALNKNFSTFFANQPKNHSHEKSILIIEDNPVNALIINNILGKEGYKTYHAENGLEALKMLDKNPSIGLVVTDGQMPVMNGYDTAEAIRNGKGLGNGFQNFTNYNIPIVALMGNKDEITAKRIKECGMNEYIEKVSPSGDLLRVVEKYLQ